MAEARISRWKVERGIAGLAPLHPRLYGVVDIEDDTLVVAVTIKPRRVPTERRDAPAAVLRELLHFVPTIVHQFDGRFSLLQSPSISSLNLYPIDFTVNRPSTGDLRVLTRLVLGATSSRFLLACRPVVAMWS